MSRINIIVQRYTSFTKKIWETPQITGCQKAETELFYRDPQILGATLHNYFARLHGTRDLCTPVIEHI